MSKSSIRPVSDSFSRLADYLPEIVVRYDTECRRTYVNKAYERATGTTSDEIIGTTIDTGWISDNPMGEYLNHLKHTLLTGEMTQFPLQITTPSGSKVYQQVTLLAEHDDEGNINGALGISYDITRLVEIQHILRDNEAKYRTLIEGANDGISIQELDENNKPGPFVEVNDALCQRLGYSTEELLRLGPMDITHPDYREKLQHSLPRLLQEGADLFESIQYTRDGRSIPVEVSVRLLMLKGKKLLFAIARDTSERKLAEQEVKHINRYLRTLSHCNEALVHATNEAQLIQDMCRVAVENGEFSLAWIGFLTEDRHIRIAASYGTQAEDFLAEEIAMPQQPDAPPERPAAMAITTGTIQVVQDIANAEYSPEWKKRAQKHGFGSAIALPLQVEAQVIGSFNIYLTENDGFDTQATTLLGELAEDISFGIQSLRVSADREHYMSRLKASMSSTIHALSSTVELRDPYTAGHQHRVAKLARAVAQHMGYKEEQMEVLYLAGVVHDIGKIAVPSEILSRPGKLTESEMRLARTHAEASYNVLKSVDFPWPIADIVRQHHERLDGSGYPQGLKGAEILPEARILAVCDVVEAMTTHRPYRPGLGIDVALQEIERGKGTLYDTSVVDACTQIVRDGFTFD
jgi:PAS domain S-box-containing protein/putative nucleotidyltransferase with HDIG domain